MYRVLFNCDINLSCTSDTGMMRGPLIRNPNGATVTIGDFDGNGQREIAIAAINTDASEFDRWTYAFSTSCSWLGCTWSPARTIDAFPGEYRYRGAPDGMVAAMKPKLAYASATAGKLFPGNSEQLVISAMVGPPQLMDYQIYRVAQACNVSTGLCAWGPARTQKTSGWEMRGGGVALGRAAGGTVAEQLFFAGIDSYSSGNDYWRLNSLSWDLGTTSGKIKEFLFERGGEPNNAMDDASYLGVFASPFTINDQFAFQSPISSTNLSGVTFRYTHLPHFITHDDIDLYRFDLAVPMNILATAFFEHARGDIDIQLLNSSGSMLAISQGTSNTEAIQISLPAGTFFLKVFGFNGATGRYGFSVSSF